MSLSVAEFIDPHWGDKVNSDMYRLARLHGLGWWAAQSRQSAKLFLQRRTWDSPTPLGAGGCAPPPFGPGGRAHSLAAKGLGESQFRRGDTHCGALYM
jgi:hypothetical protein